VYKEYRSATLRSYSKKPEFPRTDIAPLLNTSAEFLNRQLKTAQLSVSFPPKNWDCTG
jgi:hypothetical protein